MQRNFFLYRRIIISLFISLFSLTAFSQAERFSLSNDAGIQRNFKKEQRYWSLGNTTQAVFHFTPKTGVYVSYAYFTRGIFKNNVTATAKSPSTILQKINYTNSTRMKLRIFSVGWRKYLKGNNNIEDGWNLYGFAGFGLLLGNVDNTHSVSIDSVIYTIPVHSGKAAFKRLTFDIGMGWETPIGGDLFFFTEGKVWVPTTDYPSKYIFANSNAPFVAMLGVGIRVAF